MNFEEYLTSKKIDSAAFQAAEEILWSTWKEEFEQLHPNSFTVQKLNLINPIRRKYTLKVVAKEVKVEAVKTEPVKNTETEITSSQQETSVSVAPTPPKPAVARPVFKPKPKIN